MREMIGLTLLYLGYDFNSEDQGELMEARDALIAAKEGSLGFYGGPAARNLLLTGQAAYAVTFSGDALGAFAESDDIGYVIPEEGGEVWVDSLGVVANAPNAELANAFINFILRPEVGAALSNYVAYATPNREALPLVDEELRDDPVIYPSDDTIATLSFVLDVENLELYDLIWTQVKSR